MRQIHKDTGVWLDRTQRLANGLACLVLTVQQLQQLPDGMKVRTEPSTSASRAAVTELTRLQTALFAGRRSSDVTFLLLQNLFCARCMKGYCGTSAVSAVAVTDAQLRQLGVSSLEERRKVIGLPLIVSLSAKQSECSSTASAALHSAGAADQVAVLQGLSLARMRMR